MSRVYTVKSNARRDCRKLGLNPDLVIAAKGGFIINYPDAKPERKTKATRTPKPKKQSRSTDNGGPKCDRLIAMLADWTPVSELMAAMGWQAHTVRGALSTAAKVRGITIERQRVDGITRYRVAPNV